MSRGDLPQTVPSDFDPTLRGPDWERVAALMAAEVRLASIHSNPTLIGKHVLKALDIYTEASVHHSSEMTE